MAALDLVEVQARMTGVDDEVVGRAAAYRPQGVDNTTWEAVQPVLIHALNALKPPSVASFYRDTRAMMPLLLWAHRAGYVMSLESLFEPETIETWTEVAHREVRDGLTRMTKHTVTDYTSRLRNLGPKLNPSGPWQPKAGRIPGGVRKSIRAPYTDLELSNLDRAIGQMRSGVKQRLALGTMLMGLGFGGTVAELAEMTGESFQRRDSGLWALIEGKDAREVPVSEEWAERLEEFASRFAGEQLIRLTPGRNAYANQARAIDLGKKVPPISPQRFRTTWMVDRLHAGVDARLLRDWAGLTSLSFVRDMYEFLPEQDPTVGLARMHAAADRRP